MVRDSKTISPAEACEWVCDDTVFTDTYLEYGYKYSPNDPGGLYEMVAKAEGISVEEARKLLHIEDGAEHGIR